MNRLNRASGIAVWRQIADALRQLIASGQFERDEKLPPETELAARFNVNRHTVRAAIRALATEGIVESRQGQGTFIRRRARLSYPIGPRTRFSEGVAGQSQSAVTELINSTIDNADNAVSEAFQIAAGLPMIRLETVSNADGIAVSRSISWFRHDGFEDLAKAVQKTRSITKALARFGISDYSRRSTVIEAHLADEKDVELLALSPGAIVLETTAINVDAKGEPLQYSRTRFPADRISLVVQSPT